MGRFWEILGLVFFNVFGGIGFLFLVTDIFWVRGFQIEEIEQALAPLSIGCTIGGMLLVLASAFVTIRPQHPPRWWSVRIVTPIVLVACLIATVKWAMSGMLSPLMMNGLAIMAIAGSFFRM